MINSKKIIDAVTHHDGITTMMEKTETIGAIIEWEMNENGMDLAMTSKRSVNLNKILWTHGVQNVKQLAEMGQALFGVTHHHHQTCKCLAKDYHLNAFTFDECNLNVLFHLYFVCSYKSSEDERIQKEQRKLKKKRKKEEKSKKKSKKSKKSKKAKKAAKHKKDSKKKRKKKQKKVSSSSSSGSDDSSASEAENDEDVWVEKSSDSPFKKPDAAVRSSTKVKKSNDKDESGAGIDDESLVGPSVRNTSGLSLKDFGHALLPGEGAAMVCRFCHFSLNSMLITSKLPLSFHFLFSGGLYC